jgi:hypothetical protein
MSYSTIDTTAGGQNVRLLVPPNYAGRCVVYHHGVGEDYTSITGDSLKTDLVNRLTDDGYLMASSTAGGVNCGNQLALDSYAALQSYLVTNYAPDGTAIFSQSMGGLSGLLSAATRFTGLLAWFGIYPVCSLANMFGGNAGTYAGAIRDSYGIASDGSDYSSKTSGHDPALLSGSLFAGLPMRYFASYSDTSVTQTGNTDAMTAVVAASKAENIVVQCIGEHGHTSHFKPADVADFLDRAFVARTVRGRFA